jgi:hypothetical protein
MFTLRKVRKLEEMGLVGILYCDRMRQEPISFDVSL